MRRAPPVISTAFVSREFSDLFISSVDCVDFLKLLSKVYRLCGEVNVVDTPFIGQTEVIRTTLTEVLSVCLIKLLEVRFGWISRYVMYKPAPRFVRLIVRVNVERSGLNFSKEKKEIVVVWCVNR